jgi:HEAT repeat protein
VIEHDRSRARLLALSSWQLPSQIRIARALLLLVPAVLVAWLAFPPTLAAAPLSTAAPILAQLAAQAKDQSLDQVERLEALQVLAQWHTAEVLPPLLDLLKDPAREIRSVAARGLGWSGNLAAIGPLKDRALDTTEDAGVRAGALEALVKIGDASIRPMLVQTSQDPEPRVREEALRGLIDSPLHSPSNRLALATRAAQDGDLSLPFRADAIRVLTALRDPTSVPVLLKILDEGPRIKIEFPPPGSSQNEILQSRYKQIRDIRAWAARGLGELGDRATLPALVKATEDPDDVFLRYVATGALLSWRAREAVPTFVRLLDDPAHEVRIVALTAIGALGDQSNVDAVAARLSDKAVPVRLTAIATLASLGGQTARQRLEAARRTETQPEIRRAIDEAIGKLKPSAS